MNKLIHEGKVAVLYSPGFGAGWYTWCGIEEMLYDPNIIELVLKKEHDPDQRDNMILEYCERKYGEDAYYGGIDNLTVVWIDEGAEFLIDEYDGAESIRMKEDFVWLRA